MDQTYRGLLVRYQNYLLEFFQLIEDKTDFEGANRGEVEKVRHFLENVPHLEGSFEIQFSISKQSGEFSATWEAFLSEDGFHFRSFTLDDIEELEQWYLHYHSATNEYEGNLFTDGDWDLFLEEIAEVDDANGEVIHSFLSFK